MSGKQIIAEEFKASDVCFALRPQTRVFAFRAWEVLYILMNIITRALNKLIGIVDYASFSSLSLFLCFSVLLSYIS